MTEQEHNLDWSYLVGIESRPKINDIKELLKASDRFEKNCKKAPTSANWITKRDKDLETFKRFANESYPILHEDVLYLCQDFLDFKKQNGSSREKEFYKNVNILQLVDRLIRKVRYHNHYKNHCNEP